MQTSDSLCGSAVGRFQIVEQLGQGGMGEVYRAEDTKLKRPVALKRLGPALRTDSLYRHHFLEEAERASGFTDEHVAAVYDVLEEQGEIFLVMEYVQGETLRQRLQRPVTLEEFFKVAVQCAQALAAAHEHGIVHCDIKPENIMLSSSGQVKILDFGVAKHLPRADQSTTVGASIAMAGTPAYMSPEVLLGERPDGRADVFSLAVVFYEALTGTHPFMASSFVATADRIRNETPAPIRAYNRDVPEDLQAIINKALAKKPAQRYANARELLEELLRVRDGLTTSGLSAVLPLRPARRAKRFRLAGVAVLVALALALGLWHRAQITRWFGIGQPQPIHLAVLPFTFSGSDPNTKAFSDGLTETLAVKLTQLTGSYPLLVVPTSEVRAEGINTVEQARKGFGVALVLEGSVQEANGKVRVTYGLVDARSLRQLHGDAITAQSGDIFGVQDRVIENVVSMLGLQLRGEEHSALVAHGTQEPEAYDYYLRGLGYLQDYHKTENVTNAIALFSRALERDPNYALAYAGLGQAYWARYDATYEREWLDKATQACERAVALRSDLADGHTCLGTLAISRGRYQPAVEQFQNAIQLDPTSDGSFRGLAAAYERLGKLDAAESIYQRAIRLRPQYWAGYEWLASFYGRQARYAEAARAFNQAIALAPDDPHAYRSLGGIYIYMGNYHQATEVLRKAIELSPTTEAYSNLGIAYFNLRRFEEALSANEHACTASTHDYIACGNLARAYYWAPGRRAQAHEVYQRAIRMAEEALKINPRDGDPHILMANYYAMLADKDHALRHLQQALNINSDDPEYLAVAAVVHNQFGNREEALSWLEKAVARGYSKAEIRAAPELDNLHMDAKFQHLLRSK